MPIEDHYRGAPSHLRIAVVTVSDTRSEETDRSGEHLVELARRAGHTMTSRALVRDEVDAVRGAIGEALAGDADAVLVTGGTGVSPRDVTWEAATPLLEKELPGFGELFRALSYAEIGPAAMLSRATAGVARGKAVFLLPGSPAALGLAMEKLILPELGHLLTQARG